MPANTPRLETERLVLRRFTPADVEPLFFLLLVLLLRHHT